MVKLNYIPYVNKYRIINAILNAMTLNFWHVQDILYIQMVNWWLWTWTYLYMFASLQNMLAKQITITAYNLQSDGVYIIIIGAK